MADRLRKKPTAKAPSEEPLWLEGVGLAILRPTPL